MDMRIPPLDNDIMLASNPLKSRILVRILAITVAAPVNTYIYIYMYTHLFIYSSYIHIYDRIG